MRSQIFTGLDCAESCLHHMYSAIIWPYVDSLPKHEKPPEPVPVPVEKPATSKNSLTFPEGFVMPPVASIIGTGFTPYWSDKDADFLLKIMQSKGHEILLRQTRRGWMCRIGPYTTVYESTRELAIFWGTFNTLRKPPRRVKQNDEAHRRESQPRAVLPPTAGTDSRTEGRTGQKRQD